MVAFRVAMTVIPLRLRTALGLLAVLLAVAGRLASGMVVADADAGRSMAALLDTMIQCEPDAPAKPAQPAHHEADHGICSLASLLDLPSPTMAPAPALPPRRSVAVLLAAAVPPARGPPAHPPGAKLPRGPPILA